MIGRKKGYVTYDDIHQLFPEVEQDFDQLENAFATLLSAGIPYLDEDDTREPSDNELKVEEVGTKQANQKQPIKEENRLANIDTNDMIGLYLKEVGQIPLLTREQEVELAQRIERGRHSREKLDIDPATRYPYGLLSHIRQTVRTRDVAKTAKLADIPGPVLALDLVDATTR